MAYTAISVEGGLFPFDLLDRIASGDADGQRPEDFGLGGGRLSEEMQAAFSDARAYWDTFLRRLAVSRESATTLTREAWVRPLLERLGFSELPFQRGLEAGGEDYAISHRAGEELDAPPVHIVAIQQSLDKRDEGARRSPHALVQEYLNRSDALWGLVTNGEKLRLLRNSARVARPTYLEFDLRGLLEGNRYNEFVLQYRVLHRSRFPRTAADAHDCRLERYYQQGIDEGGRVREKLRDGVESALRDLGSAFLRHADSDNLRTVLQTGRLDALGYYRQLLRLVYRLLFLFVAEERRLLTSPDAANAERQSIYTQYYSVARLRERCDRYFGDDHHADLWQGLLRTFALFRSEEAALQLGLAALNGELFGPLACPDLETAGCENASLLRAVYQLSTFADDRVRRRVNYAALGVEELGSVYESLLDFHPEVSVGETAMTFDLVAGSERRQTGSYYTSPELVRELIEHALVPVLTERLALAKTPEAKEATLLGLRVCDPASGSGHFLLEAARRIGREVARIRTDEEEPTPAAYRTAVRDVIRSCIYAVDRNPLAVDLCKVALWIEGYGAGLPLSFLDAHVKCGDSLVGVSDLGLLTRGIPDEAYAATTPQENEAAKYLRQRNKRERETGQYSLDTYSASRDKLTSTLVQGFSALSEIEERTPDQVKEKERLYESLRGSGTGWWTYRVACDLWTAAFFLPRRIPDNTGDQVPTTDTVRRALSQPNALPGRLVGEAMALGQKHPFFHWPLEFPEVVLQGGFDAMLGNPPFMGGLKISERFGDRYRSALSVVTGSSGGLADLRAYMYRRAFSLLKDDGFMGMVATNTIGQGDTREQGLAVMLRQGGALTFAQRFVKWPGAANVEVNLIGVRKGPWNGLPTLDGRQVDFISSRLDEEPEQEPLTLVQNRGKAFQGSIVRGIGFVLEPEEAERLIARDARNRDCLFPYLTGEDLNSRPDQSPSRWVINFGNWSLDRAREYPDLLQIVEERVKPERDNVKQSKEREKWWLFARLRGEMHDAIRPLQRVLARSRVSELHAVVFVSKERLFSDATIVFALENADKFALLQSNAHEAWVWKNASSLESRNRYTPEDCFDNFPFPQNPEPDATEWIARIGAEYHEHRHQTMVRRNLGLTKAYNLFNNSTCDDADIVRLRDLHAEMDRAVLACYGWSDLDPGHDFHENERGQTRFTISAQARREVLRRLLRRLLELNLEIAGHEQAAAQPAAASAPLLVSPTVHERVRTVATPVSMFSGTAIAPRTTTKTRPPPPAPPTVATPSPRPPSQPLLPGVPAPEKALRERVFKRALDMLATNPPLTGREIAQRLNQLDARIDRHLVNSVLSNEGGPYVVHDGQTGRYRLKRR